MKAHAVVVGLLGALNAAEETLSARMLALLGRYFAFLGAYRDPRSSRRLRMRALRDPAGRVTALSWTRRIRATRMVAGKIQRLTRRLREPFRRAWVFHIARDWSRVELYVAFDRERVSLNRLHAAVARLRRRIRLSLENGWGARASDDDRLDALRLVEASPALTKRDARALAGALVLAREWTALEVALGTAVDEYRAALGTRSDVGFEPVVKRRASGALRLVWGYPRRVLTRSGPRVITDHIRGWPTDRWMRSAHVRAASRKMVSAFVRRLRILHREYGRLVARLGQWRAKVHVLSARVTDAASASAPIPTAS